MNFGQIDAPILLYLGTTRSLRVPQQFGSTAVRRSNPIEQYDCTGEQVTQMVMNYYNRQAAIRAEAEQKS
jgi:hypothetical protein